MKVRELRILLATMPDDADVVILDTDNCGRQIAARPGNMMPSVTGRDKFVGQQWQDADLCWTLSLEAVEDDDEGEDEGSLEMTLTEDAVDEIEANCNYDDGYPSCSLLSDDEDETVHMVHINAVLTVDYPQEGYEEEMTVVKMDGRLRDGTCPFVTLEGQGGDRYIVTILPSGKVVFETGMWGMATPSS